MMADEQVFRLILALFQGHEVVVIVFVLVETVLRVLLSAFFL